MTGINPAVVAKVEGAFSKSRADQYGPDHIQRNHSRAPDDGEEIPPRVHGNGMRRETARTGAPLDFQFWMLLAEERDEGATPKMLIHSV